MAFISFISTNQSRKVVNVRRSITFVFQGITPLRLFLFFKEKTMLTPLGVDVTAMDHEVRPQDDFFRYVNGTWMKTFPIPDDKSRYGAFDRLADDSDEAVKSLIESAKARRNDVEVKVADLYESFMDTETIEAKGVAPLSDDLSFLRSMDGTMQSFAKVIAKYNEEGKMDALPLCLSVIVDRKATSKYIVSVRQGGLGMPDRDYYLKEGEEAEALRNKYKSFLETLLEISGEALAQGWSSAKVAADAIFGLEKQLAEKHWTKVENRDVEKTYNKVPLADLRSLTDKIDLFTVLIEAKIRTEATDGVIIAQPSYLTSLGEIVVTTALNVWRVYFAARLLAGQAFFLSDVYVDTRFKWTQALTGQPAIRPRWQRGVMRVNSTVGELVGQLYVDKHFPASSKDRMVALVENLREAYRERIQGLPWMSETTKTAAYEKLEKFRPMIGYPDKWIDYSSLVVVKDDLVGNLCRANVFQHQRECNKLGTPVDRTEWHMNPQTVNAYYSPALNVIVFPAAILQPPFFNPIADDAVNYGAIGAVIGHEMGHGFDDQGSKSDGEGMLRNWWSEDDYTAFKKRTANLVKQFASYEPVADAKINGELTLGENIGDLGGLTVAHHAYRMSLRGLKALPPAIEGFTGDQRFFLGWGQVWRTSIREKALRMQIATDPHSPAEYRVNGIVCNMPEFHQAWDVKPGDRHYLPEEECVQIW